MKNLGFDHHMETSALTGYNVDSLFEVLCKHLYLDNGHKLSEFRAASHVQGDMPNDALPNNGRVDLYAAKPKKKKGCAC